jgi:hypothetical protein
MQPRERRRQGDLPDEADGRPQFDITLSGQGT